MKKLLLPLILVASFVFGSCEKSSKQDETTYKAKRSQEYVKVGTLDANGNPVLHLDIPESTAILNWEAEILRQTGTAINLETIAIDYNDDINEYNELIQIPALANLKFEDYQIYSIIAKSSDAVYKTAYRVDEINGDLYARISGPIITVTCVGCSIGCSPKMLGNANICYPECPNGAVPCTKTETVTTGPDKLAIFGTNYVAL